MSSASKTIMCSVTQVSLCTFRTVSLPQTPRGRVDACLHWPNEKDHRHIDFVSFVFETDDGMNVQLIN
jgi:hypothetical protein